MHPVWAAPNVWGAYIVSRVDEIIDAHTAGVNAIFERAIAKANADLDAEIRRLRRLRRIRNVSLIIAFVGAATLLLGLLLH